MPIIAIYAGHGGDDPGAVGNGVLEKNLNLSVSNTVSGILRQWGYTVLNNRMTDVNRDIAMDIIYANENRVDALVEIHQNSNEGVPQSGSEVIYSISDTGKGKDLAGAILKHLVALGFRDRGIKTMVNADGEDAFAIIRLTKMPAVIVECAFINNPNDMALFNVNRVAQAIADGVREVFPIKVGETPVYPGAPLRPGSTGEAVRQVQHCLNNISGRHPDIPRIAEDGIFGNETLFAVITFQRLFGLTPDGVVGPITWDRIMSECGETGGGGGACVRPEYPGTIVGLYSTGEPVLLIQRCLNKVSVRFPSIPRLPEDGIFGSLVLYAVVEFQRLFGLTTDGLVGPVTWDKLMSEGDLCEGNFPPYPGTPLRLGSFGAEVLQIQSCLNNISNNFPGIPHIFEDSIFGVLTRGAVIAFQESAGLEADGVVGPLTWNRLMRECGATPQSYPTAIPRDNYSNIQAGTCNCKGKLSTADKMGILLLSALI